jgi:glutathione S-transferase
VWLLEELNLEYELKVFKRDSNFRAGDDLKAVHPLGKSPVIGITPAGSEKEIIVAESETIVEYVCEHFGRHMIPQRYPEGKEGVLGAENDEFMRYRVRIFLSPDWGLRQVISLPTTKRQLCVVADDLLHWTPQTTV